MAAKQQPVPRPTKKTEYQLVFATRDADKSWRDLLATQRNALVDAWDFLTRTPQAVSPKNHPLKGDLGAVTHQGRTREQWQHELTGGARLWFYIDNQRVVLVQLHTRHPNETK